jgi:hypothetical protein
MHRSKRRSNEGQKYLPRDYSMKTDDAVSLTESSVQFVRRKTKECILMPGTYHSVDVECVSLDLKKQTIYYT